MIPPKLKAGDHIRVIAPSHSLAASFTEDMKQQAIQGLEKLGLRVSFGKYVEERNDFETASIEHRLEDLYDAFTDPDVNGVLAARGGSSITQLLKYIDYDIIKNNPKVFCGLSDITALSYALHTKTGLVNYYGPHFTMLGSSRATDYSFESMRLALFEEEPYQLKPCELYNNAPGESQLIVNEGHWAISEGKAAGRIIGGNFLTTNFVLGSEFMPDIADSILFMEENHIMDFKDVHNELQSILNHSDGRNIKGLVIGRFQKETGMTRELLTKLVKSKNALEGLPVAGNIDFGHTAPMLSFPIGGEASLEVKEDGQVKIEITKH